MTEPEPPRTSTFAQRILERRARGIRPDLIGLKDVAQHLGCSERTVDRLRRSGLPVFLCGPKILGGYSDIIQAWYQTAFDPQLKSAWSDK